MQMVKKTVVILLTLWITTILFAPKKDLYFYVQKHLQTSGILLQAEKTEETALGLKWRELHLSYKGLEIGTWRSAEAWTLIFYTEFEAKQFIPSQSFQRLFDGQIEKMHLHYTLLDPERIALVVSGTFGTARGWIELQQKRIFLRWKKIGKLETLRNYLKQDKKGWYYEQRF